MRQGFFIVLLLFLTGCNSDKLIYYTFNGVCLTRIDYDGATNFYYGRLSNINDISKKTGFIRAEYFGLNNGMDMVVVFKEDKSIELINAGVDKLEKKGDCRMNIFDYENIYIDSILDSYKKRGLGLYRICDVTKLEKKFPQNRNSLVVVSYEQ